MPERYLGRQIGKYHVIRLLGGGAFAWVYEAIDQDLEIPVALKILRPEFAGDPTAEARFRREASTAARLRHRNIVIVRDVGQSDGASFVAMDLLRGSLGQRLRTKASLPEPEVVRLGLDVAAALAAAHAAGVVHRDIKPDNILFGPAAEAVVADFGLARALSGDSALSATNQVMGTPHYFSPEQARGLTLDGRSDLYSLGVTLYRAATGLLPFDGDDWYVVGRHHIDSPVPPPRGHQPSLSAQFEQVLLKLLSKLPDERYPSANALYSALSTLPTAVGDRKDPPAVVSSATDGPFPPIRSATGPHGVESASLAARTTVPAVSLGNRLWQGVGIAASLIIIAGMLFRSPWGGNRAARAASEATARVRDSLITDSAGKEVLRDSLLDVRLESPATARSAKTDTTPSRSVIPSVPVNAVGRLELRSAADAELFVNGKRVGMGSWSGDEALNREIRLRAVIDDAPAGCASAELDSSVRVTGSGRSVVSLGVLSCRAVKLDVMPRDASLQFTPREGGRALRLRADSVSGALLTLGRYEVVGSYPRCVEYRDSLNVTRTATGDSLLLRVRLQCGLGADIDRL